MALRIQPYAVLAADAAVELRKQHLMAVPLRGALLMARWLDWVRVGLAVEMDLRRKARRLAKG